MKKLLFPVLVGGLFMASCQSAPEADSAEASEAQEVTASEGVSYAANLETSSVEWTGTKPVGSHHGTFKLNDGNLIVSGDEITGGSFIIDISSLQADDQNDEYNAKLGGHLLSPDFFDAEKYPTGTFEITGVTTGVEQTEDLVMKDATHMITGNLTLKETTKSISFPAVVTIADGNVSAEANFNIDRTQFGMVYGNDESLGDRFIRPEVNLVVHLTAAQQM